MLTHYTPASDLPRRLFGELQVGDVFVLAGLHLVKTDNGLGYLLIGCAAGHPVGAAIGTEIVCAARPETPCALVPL